MNSSFLIASPDGKTADELRADPAAVQGLGRAFSLLVQRVARGVGRGRPGSPPSSNQQEGMNPGLGGNNTVGGMPQGIPGQQGTQDGGTSNQRPVMGAEQGQQTMGRPQGEQPGPPDNESNGTQTSAQNVTPLARRRLLRRSTVWDRTRALFEHDRRYLAVELDTASATIYDFEDTPCTEDDGAVAASRQGGAEQNCITVFGKFRIIVDEDEDIAEVYATYVEATNAYIANGTLEETLLEVDPDTNFTVLGVSDVVDENFDAFEEIAVVDDGMSSESDTDTETPTPSNVSTTPTPTNASSSTSENDEEDTSSAIALTLKFVSLLSATFMSVLIL